MNDYNHQSILSNLNEHESFARYRACTIEAWSAMQAAEQEPHHLSTAAKYFNAERLIAINVKRLLRVGVPPQSNAEILDIGCGTGLFVLICNLLGNKAVGLDIPSFSDPVRTRLFVDLPARLEIPIYRKRLDSSTALDAYGQFDLITGFATWFNRGWDDAHWLTFLSNLKRALQPSGRLVMTLNSMPDVYGETQFVDRHTKCILGQTLSDDGWLELTWQQLEGICR